MDLSSIRCLRLIITFLSANVELVGTTSQIISKDTAYRSESYEPFHSITLTVQNKANVEESLAALIEGDLLSGENKYQLPDGTKVGPTCCVLNFSGVK